VQLANTAHGQRATNQNIRWLLQSSPLPRATFRNGGNAPQGPRFFDSLFLTDVGNSASIRICRLTDLRDGWFKMVESKTKRNAQRSKSEGNFQIRSKPIVHVAKRGRSPDVAEGMTLPRVYGSPILFVIAQDEHTIFASWNIDWRSVFEKAMPADRQVYLRLFGCNGLEEKRVAVEPMAAMHYVTISGQYDTYRVEIGYYQPANIWHSVAISEEVKVPSQGSTEIAAV